jgi:hypothetical protein
MTTHRNNLIIPGTVRFDSQITINIDTVTGTTELKVTRGKLEQVQVLGILSEHSTTLLRNMISLRQIAPGAIMSEPPTTENTNGGNNDAA